MKARKILVPSYMQQFRCIGSACEDSCCTGWRVDIDQEAYKKYTKIQDKELRPIIEKNIKRHNSNRSDEHYAKIKILPNQQCVFLSEEKMCKIRELSRAPQSSEQFVWLNRRYGETETQLSPSAIMPSTRADSSQNAVI
jgi:hypothetical protein